MNATFKNFLLATVLIAVPAGGFALAEHYLAGSAAGAHRGLGDLSLYKAIVADTKRIASGGDLAAAERRITDLETRWDENAHKLRQMDRAAWNAIDSAADEAFAALRAGNPDPVDVEKALTDLSDTLENPEAQAPGGPVRHVAGIAVTDETGHALPCEEMIGQLKTALEGKTASPEVADLRSKALERCNADDDTRADAFAAKALSRIEG